MGREATPTAAPAFRVYTPVMADIKRISAYPPQSFLCRSGSQAFVYLCVPKCASSAMGQYLKRHGAKAMGRVYASNYHHRMAIIRHPVARTVSAYNFGWRSKGFSFEEWWEFVRKNPSFDRHTMPTVQCLSKIKTETRQLEQISDWWGDWQSRYPWVFTEPPPVVNASNKGPVSLPAGAVEDIEHVYSEDLSLWDSSSIGGMRDTQTLLEVL